jgi:AraC-like DNA-binding protein
MNCGTTRTPGIVQIKMSGSSTSSFNSADEYRASLADIFAEITPFHPGAFAAHVNRAAVGHLRLLQARESLPRVAYVALQSDLVFISFSVNPKLPLIWRGVTLEPDEIMLHACGEHLHQRTVGSSRWGLIALSPATLRVFCKIETGEDLKLPHTSQIIRPPPLDWKCLLRVHCQAAQISETRPVILGKPEVVHAMEQEIVGLLARCLIDGEVRPELPSTWHGVDVMRRFESVLAKFPQRSTNTTAFAAKLGVSLRTFKGYCIAFLGVSPRQYVQMRQLLRARALIRGADPRTARIAELARIAGFTYPGRFAKLYKIAYGETPIVTLRHAVDL